MSSTIDGLGQSAMTSNVCVHDRCRHISSPLANNASSFSFRTHGVHLVRSGLIRLPVKKSTYCSNAHHCDPTRGLQSQRGHCMPHPGCNSADSAFINASVHFLKHRGRHVGLLVACRSGSRWKPNAPTILTIDP